MADRIQQMMAELSLDQVDLLDRVPDMSAQTLSILLKRRSRKSQFAPQIAEALGVTAGWLLSGASPKYARRMADLECTPMRPPPRAVRDPTAIYGLSPDEKALLDAYRALCAEQRGALVRFATLLAKPKTAPAEQT